MSNKKNEVAVEVEVQAPTYAEMIISLADEGKTKDAISDVLAEIMATDGMAFSKIQKEITKAFQESGIRFRKSNDHNWKTVSANYMMDNPTCEIGDLQKHLESADVFTASAKSTIEDKAKYYSKEIYAVMKYMIDGLTPATEESDES